MIAFTAYPSLERWAGNRHRSTALMLRDQLWRAIGMLAVCLINMDEHAYTVEQLTPPSPEPRPREA
ncbi:hypothetical protein [Sorangium sp. So ce1000]|uniref:hypothetical protein n=1 Tax=Sorangium sp. So ce1000 TaxID=3133325 RepID=UPI003F621A61